MKNFLHWSFANMVGWVRVLRLTCLFAVAGAIAPCLLVADIEVPLMLAFMSPMLLLLTYAGFKLTVVAAVLDYTDYCKAQE